MAYTNIGAGIESGHWLATNDYMTADLGGGNQFFFILQSDGNIVWYHGSGPDDQGPYIWRAFNTSPEYGACCLGLPHDGNLTLFRGTSPQNNTDIVWQLGKSGPKGTYYFVICVWGANAFNDTGQPTLGVFADNPNEKLNPAALWTQQTGWSL